MDRQHNCLYSNNKPISEGGRNDSDSEIIRKTTEMSKNNLVASVGTGSILDYSDISWVGEQKERAEMARETEQRETEGAEIDTDGAEEEVVATER